MADVVLLPLEKLPEPITGADVEDARHNAEWASRFAPTNLAERYWANQKITGYRDLLQEQHAAALENRIQTDQTAQNYFFKSKELEMKEAAAAQALREGDVKMQQTLESFPLAQKVRESQLLLNGTRERAAMNAELRKAEEENRRLEHTDQLGEHMANLSRVGIYPGSVEYHRGVEEGLRRFPFVPAQTHIDLRSTAKIIPRPEDAPVEVTRTTEVVGDGTDQIRTERTVTSQKQSRAGYEATTPPAGGEFLRNLGIKGAAPAPNAPAAPAAQRQAPAPAPVARTAGAPDRAELARRALADPNASEAHKAAARRILGQ